MMLWLALRLAASDPPRQLLDDAVAAINSRDRDRELAFLRANSTDSSGATATVEAWTDLARAGAPFTLEPGGAAAAGGALTVFGRDRLGDRVYFKLAFDPGPPPRLSSLAEGAGYELDGPDPELANWTEPNRLARAVAVRYGVPGLALAILQRGQLVGGSSGVRRVGDDDPVAPDDVFSIGSIGKAICATVIARLIDRGTLRWEETLGEALPGVPIDPGYASATLEQAMRHRAGFPAELALGGPRLRRIVGDDDDPVAMRDRYARDVLGRPPAAPPGARFLYSNADYAVLAHVAEKATGKPYETLLHELIFDPLNMRQSYAFGDPLPPDRPHGNRAGPDGFRPSDVEPRLGAVLAGAGFGLKASAGDLVKFGAAHLAALRGDGSAFLTPETARRLHATGPGFPNGRDYGCGWIAESVPGVEPFQDHEGSDETMRAQLALFPKADLVVAVLTNSGDERDPGPTMDAVLAIAAKLAPAGAKAAAGGL